nr:immunoglobulin heavy chain junction region [Macaca mulatta]MOX58934.1 immunoglobulin heavy chain junction region [Macaca mulatta]MOX59114.1 immunoglobulin heavy chain junction region [Macaca mulatta]MOX59295.1 immunoglobulin heavy chain junction region [Macaca mulatta]MOX59414.1 immunoglobulin heavy chain junction region [Macaca mulatta]
CVRDVRGTGFDFW